MAEKFFLFDPNGDGLRFYETEVEARNHFNLSVECVKDILADPEEGLEADDLDICWGEVKGRIKILEEETGVTVYEEEL